MPTNPYGSFSPQAIDPFPIETTLAKEAITSPAYAQKLLDSYQLQRDISQNIYSDQAQQQHQYAYDQLRSQMQDNAIKNMVAAAKEPGMLKYLTSFPQYQGSFGGGDPGMLETLTAQQQALQRAETAQKGGAGILDLTRAGFQPSSEGAQSVAPGVAGPQGTPLELQIARERIASAAANARARGAGGGEARMSTNMPPSETSASGESIPVHVSFPKGATLEQKEKMLRDARETANLQARMDQPKSGVRGIDAPERVATDPATQNRAKIRQNSLPPDAKEDVRANSAGNIVPAAPDGGLYGKSGRKY